MNCKYCNREITNKRGRGDYKRIICGSKECLIQQTRERSRIHYLSNLLSIRKRHKEYDKDHITEKKIRSKKTLSTKQ